MPNEKQDNPTMDLANVAEIERVITALHTTPIPAEAMASLLQTLAWQCFALFAEVRHMRAALDQMQSAAVAIAPQIDAVLSLA